MLIQVGIASYDGKVCAATTDALLAETVIGYGQGVHLLVDWVSGNALIGCARDILVERFLQVKEASCLVMVDTDISWVGGDLIKLAQRSAPVVGATYRLKSRTEKYHARGPIEKVGDLYRVAGLPAGFLKIDRSAFEKMGPAKFTNSGHDIGDYFPAGMRDGVYFGEDYGFCQNWREIGGDVWLDPSPRLKHFDGAQFYTGDPRWWLDAQIRIERKESLAHCLAALRNETDTPQTYHELIAAWGNDDLWTGSPEMLADVADLARQSGGPIVEFGSGLTTIVMRALTDQPIVVFESDQQWADRVTASLEEAGLASVDMRVVSLGADKFYAVDSVPDGVAVVFDGPSDQEARLSGMEWMWRALKLGGKFVFDDLQFPLLGDGFKTNCDTAGVRYRVIESLNGKLHAIGRK